MQPDIERRKCRPGQGHGALESIDTNAEEYRITERGTQACLTDPNIRFQRAVTRLHRLGERALGSFVAELSGRLMIQTQVEQLLACARFDPAIVEAAGTDKSAPVSLHAVEATP
jgi:hypothetical protein